MHSYYPETKSTCNLQGVNARKLDKDILEHIYIYILSFNFYQAAMLLFFI